MSTLGTDGEIYLKMPEWYDGEDEYFEITLCETDEVVGNIVFSPGYVLFTGNVSCEVYTEYQGHAYAKKALKLLAKTLFNQPSNSNFQLEYEDFFISIFPGNVASIKTAVGAGATLEKIVDVPKGFVFKGGRKYDHAIMFKIRPERRTDENDKVKRRL